VVTLEVDQKLPDALDEDADPSEMAHVGGDMHRVQSLLLGGNFEFGKRGIHFTGLGACPRITT